MDHTMACIHTNTHMHSIYTHTYTRRACKTWTSVTRPGSEALCFPSVCLTTAQTVIWDVANSVAARFSPKALHFTMISKVSSLHGNLLFYFIVFCPRSFFFMIKHLWSCLSGLSSQFSPTRHRYEWLICMWTGAFTSVLIETVVACVAWFPSTEDLWRAGREDKSVTRM